MNTEQTKRTTRPNTSNTITSNSTQVNSSIDYDLLLTSSFTTAEDTIIQYFELDNSNILVLQRVCPIPIYQALSGVIFHVDNVMIGGIKKTNYRLQFNDHLIKHEDTCYFEGRGMRNGDKNGDYSIVFQYSYPRKVLHALSEECKNEWKDALKENPISAAIKKKSQYKTIQYDHHYVPTYTDQSMEANVEDKNYNIVKVSLLDALSGAVLEIPYGKQSYRVHFKDYIIGENDLCYIKINDSSDEYIAVKFQYKYPHSILKNLGVQEKEQWIRRLDFDHAAGIDSNNIDIVFDSVASEREKLHIERLIQMLKNGEKILLDETVKEMFSEADKDNNQQIDFTEFKNYIQKMKIEPEMTDKEIRKLFNHYDKDNNEQISLEEMMTTFYKEAEENPVSDGQLDLLEEDSTTTDN